MRAFIVTMEYRGQALRPGEGALRVPVCEHAYNLETATLAGHRAGDLPRIGFPARQRGWNSPPEAARCPACDTIVQRIVRDLIATVLSAITSRRPRPGQGPRRPARTRDQNLSSVIGPRTTGRPSTFSVAGGLAVPGARPHASHRREAEMTNHDHHRHVEISDGDRVVAGAEVITHGPDGAAQVSLHAEPGHIAPGSRARLVDAVLALPEVQDSTQLEAAFPLGDGETLSRLCETCQDVQTRPAGASALLTARLPPRTPAARPDHPASR